MSRLNWDDQPAVLLDAQRVANFSIGRYLVEVRRKGETYYITVGDLFGSQSLEVLETDAIFKLLEAVASGRSGQTVPDGLILMDDEC